MMPAALCRRLGFDLILVDSLDALAASDALGVVGASLAAQATRRGVLAIGDRPEDTGDIVHELAHLLVGFPNDGDIVAERRVVEAHHGLASLLDEPWRSSAKPFEFLAKPEGSFASYSEWVNKASSWLSGYRKVACFDQKGRLCAHGSDFMLARDEEAFPVVYFVAGPHAHFGSKREASLAELSERAKFEGGGR